MTRLKQAWLALTGRLEPEVREVRQAQVREVVFGEPSVANLYVVHVPDKNGGSIKSMSGNIIWMKREPRYFTSCEQAHSENPGEYVEQKQAIRIGGRYFIAEKLSEATPQPKPKVAKGKRG